jgi:hypothetical protein
MFKVKTEFNARECLSRYKRWEANLYKNKRACLEKLLTDCAKAGQVSVRIGEDNLEYYPEQPDIVWLESLGFHVNQTIATYDKDLSQVVISWA